MRVFIDAFDLARVQFVIRKVLVEFPKEFSCTDGIVIPQRRARQQQLCKRLQIMTVTSVVTSKPANRGHFKTGQWERARTSHSFTLTARSGQA